MCFNKNAKETVFQCVLSYTADQPLCGVCKNLRGRMEIIMKKNLLKKAAALFTCGIMFTAGSTPVLFDADAANNIISNGSFDGGTSGWSTYKQSGGSCSLGTENGQLALKISSVGTLNYSVQVGYDIVPLYQNGVYHLSYDISCTTDRFIEGMIQQNGGTYQAYTWKGISLTSEPQKVDYQFTMEAETDIMAKLVFNCGTQGEDLPEHTIYLDNVSLELVDDSQVDYEAFMPYEPDILTNQVGYVPDSTKTAVFRDVTSETEFSVLNADTNETVYTGTLTGGTFNSSANETDYYGDFSSVTEPGKYYITCGALDDSYTFEIADNVYDDLFDSTVRMLYFQRCGCEVSAGAFSHPACHTGTAVVYGTNQAIDVTGGWHDAGDYGRYIVAAAKAVADLLYAYDANPDMHTDSVGIPESGNGVPDILDEVRYELEWMLKMQDSSGGVYHKVTCENFPGYIMPQYEKDTLIVTPISTTATADFCASMAMAYEFYYDIDKAFAEKCLAAAEKAWDFLQANPNLIFNNPTDITTGEYGDSSDLDERYWAAAQMYRATKRDEYLSALDQAIVKTGLDWSTVGSYGLIALLTMDDIDTESTSYTRAYNALITQAKTALKNTSNSGYGISVTTFNWGSNMTIANSGITLSIAAEITGDEKYAEAAETALHYLLGRNPNGVCYVSGYGTVSPLNPHHRPSMAAGQAMPGMLVGGVNENLEDSAAKAYLATVPAAKCYVDHSESYSTNEIAIYWNSPLTYLMSLIEDVEEEAPVQGDVNADGSFTVADVVMMQKYLLGIGTLTDMNAGNVADSDSAASINIFDLAVMKKMIAQN